MRKLLLILALAVVATAVAAQEPPANPEAPKAITVVVEPLGDNDTGVVTRVAFSFASPPEVAPEAPLFLQGSFMQNGQVIRNFRIPVFDNQRGPITTIQPFAAGPAEIEVRLLMPVEEGAPVLLHKTNETVTLVKTGKAYVAGEDDGVEGILAEGIVPETVGAVRIVPPRRDVALNLFKIAVDVDPQVKRVEFFVDGKKIMARNAPPYNAELDLGKLPKRVEVRVVGYDERGHYVDADAFVVNERETPLEVKITRVVSNDGIAHFKLAIQNPKGTNFKTVALYAGDKKLHEWTRPPYALDIPVARLNGVEFVRASVIDTTGYEAADLLFLNSDRYIEQIDVNLIELPVSVSDASGNPITDLKQKNFTVLENDKPQSITSFNFAANLPLSIGVLIDHSGSMEKRIEDAKAAALEFFKGIMKQGDKVFVAGFAGDPSRNAPFVTQLATLQAQVEGMPKPAGGTALYDAIVTGLYRFRNLQGRKALVVITDGEDTTSRLTWDDMTSYLRAARVPVYFIGIGLGAFGGGSMKSIAAETGGLAYFISNTKQLTETYKQLEKELRSQYLIAYQSESTKNDQAYRTILVKVDRPDAKVRTIRGYIP
ncbi:MAG TPA: VWA domain-containing protein [Thermoanaerobaculia bacterium]|nr:VWA domain-containing protein [Thermoanaerobaculia bacterium]